jgi:hypothetical protein
MRAEEGMSYEEIAAAVGISVGAAKVKVHRPRARLSVSRTMLANDLAGFCFEGRVQRESAVPAVFKPMPFDTPVLLPALARWTMLKIVSRRDVPIGRIERQAQNPTTSR